MRTKLSSTIIVLICFLSCNNEEDFTNYYTNAQTQDLSEEQAYTILENFLTRDSNGLFLINISPEGAAIYNINNTTYNKAVSQIEALNFHLSRHPQYALLYKTPFYHNQQKTRATNPFVYWNINETMNDGNMATGTIEIGANYSGPAKVPFKNCAELFLYLKGTGYIYIKDKTMRNFYVTRQQYCEIQIYLSTMKDFYITNKAGYVTGLFYAYTKEGVIQTR